MKGTSNKSWHIYIIVGVIVSLPWLVYLGFFCGQTISTNTSDWGSFGDYIGGVSSVITAFVVIYISRHLDRKDTYHDKMRSAISEIYDQLVKIDADNVDSRKNTKFLRLVDKNRLYLPESLYKDLIKLHDYYVSLQDNAKRIPEFEVEVFDSLRKLYD